jgi:TM2 domain-containing membrane protein YozV
LTGKELGTAEIIITAPTIEGNIFINGIQINKNRVHFQKVVAGLKCVIKIKNYEGEVLFSDGFTVEKEKIYDFNYSYKEFFLKHKRESIEPSASLWLADLLIKKGKFDELSLDVSHLSRFDRFRLYDINKKNSKLGWFNIIIPGLGDMILGNYGWGIFNFLSVTIIGAFVINYYNSDLFIFGVFTWCGLYITNVSSPFAYALDYNRQLLRALHVDSGKRNSKSYVKMISKPERQIQVPLLALRF